MSTLHLVNRSPFSSRTLESLEKALTEGDAVLLIEDGVYGVLCDALASLGARARLYALEEDCSARGLEALDDGVERIDVAGFVRLSAECQRTLAWFQA